MAGDDQDIAEAFDTDKLDDDHDEPVGQLTYPPDRLLGANDPTADDRVTDSVASREDRLEPDPLDDPLDDLGEFDPLDEAAGPAGGAGRLIEPGADDDAVFPLDEEPDAVATLAPEGEDLTAEEAAVHLERESPRP